MCLLDWLSPWLESFLRCFDGAYGLPVVQFHFACLIVMGSPPTPQAAGSSVNRADAVRAKLAELGLSEGDVADAVAWARSQPRSGG